jgi:LysR family transcriptional activator of mexEF-oprN operon
MRFASAIASAGPAICTAPERLLISSKAVPVPTSPKLRITNELLRRIPGAALIVLATDYHRASGMLDRGEVSMVLGYLVKLPSVAKVRRLRTVRYLVLRRGPQTDRLTLRNYCNRKHAIVTFAGDLKGYIDESLEELKASRTIVLSLPQFASIPKIIQASDLVVTVPDYVADTLIDGDGLVAEKLPFNSPTFSLSMAWRAAVDNDPAERLLRDIIAQAIRGDGSHRSRG